MSESQQSNNTIIDTISANTTTKHDEAIKHNHGLTLLIFMLTVATFAQILIYWWSRNYQRSYITWSMIVMYIVPFCISAYRHYWRFVSIWIVISAITIALVWRPLTKPNFSGSGSTIPRLLYKWFFMLFVFSNLTGFIGYIILLLTFMGVNVLLNISPVQPIDIGAIMLFYGTYYGVLCRDFTDFLVDHLAARIGYYNPNSALPSKYLSSNICAICGMEHDHNEDMSLERLTKNDTLLGDGSHSGDQETLIDFSDNTPRSEIVFVLTCGHKFHEYCLYGWCLVGKRQVCPFCQEKVDLNRIFSASPFQKPQLVYGNLLNLVRYLFAWQPLIFLVSYFFSYEFDL